MKDLKNIKERLVLEKEELLSEIKKIGIADSSDPGGFVAKETNSNINDVPDNADLASELENLGNNHAILIELETRLLNVEKALDAIEYEHYGKCSVCNKDIQEKRLEANLAATTCMEHAE